eukprot:TRINITY_DN18826_c0_g1_i1.p1 TRINITY_DN18826_c0_g1~~TRINITY_DN18826_c0_g1_i1.p1  ORF type:complete len:180 (-),score=38.48 TRINITY_DN18826_c0_g1_i1:7-546(-)
MFNTLKGLVTDSQGNNGIACVCGELLASKTAHRLHIDACSNVKIEAVHAMICDPNVVKGIKRSLTDDDNEKMLVETYGQLLPERKAEAAAEGERVPVKRVFYVKNMTPGASEVPRRIELTSASLDVLTSVITKKFKQAPTEIVCPPVPGETKEFAVGDDDDVAALKNDHTLQVWFPAFS